MFGHTEANITFGEILGHGLLWLLISIVTAGIGLMFYPYSFSKFVINRTYVYQDGKRYSLRCELGIGGQLGHILLWLLLTIVTLGIAFPFYLYKVWNICLNNTTLQG